MKSEWKDINSLMAGDERAFIAFMDHYSSILYHYAFNIVHQKESAEEIVSDAFFEVWESRKLLDKIENIQGWLYRIVYNKSISFLRKENRQKGIIPLDELENFTFELCLSQEEKLIEKEKLVSLNKAILSLPSKCRHVLYLVKIEGMSYAKVAELLNISTKTVSNHLTFAMKKLIEVLKDDLILLILLIMVHK